MIGRTITSTSKKRLNQRFSAFGQVAVMVRHFQNRTVPTTGFRIKQVRGYFYSGEHLHPYDRIPLKRGLSRLIRHNYFHRKPDELTLIALGFHILLRKMNSLQTESVINVLHMLNQNWCQLYSISFQVISAEYTVIVRNTLRRNKQPISSRVPCIITQLI